MMANMIVLNRILASCERIRRMRSHLLNLSYLCALRRLNWMGLWAGFGGFWLAAYPIGLTGSSSGGRGVS